MNAIREPERMLPIVANVDLCVVGGSCTGVFAAVRAARLGATVAIVENNGFFGGVATAGLVNIWHSLKDDHHDQTIIGGLTSEVIRRLHKRDAVRLETPEKDFFVLNTEELKIELDALIHEAKVRPFLHTRFSAPFVDIQGNVDAIAMEDKTGRRAIRARYFIDATGDGDLIARIGLETSTLNDLQPPTACAVLEGLAKVKRQNPGFELEDTVFNPSYPEALKRGFLWSSDVFGSDDLTMVAGTRISHADCSDADQLTTAEMEGRRQVRAMVDILRNHVPEGQRVFLRALPSYIGVRETRHARCLHMLTENELLRGVRFDDAIANGTYRVDVHHSDKPGLTFRHLDGREDYVVPGLPVVSGRWLESGQEGAPFYQIPLRSLIPRNAINVVVAGRLIDAGRGAYGATRVMVNCNQTGEAAGVACVDALNRNVSVQAIDAGQVRKRLNEGGSVMI